MEQNPTVPGDKEPDYLIEGKVFDCYAPKYGTSAKNIFRAAKGKVEDGQTRRIVLNLDDSSASIPKLVQVFRQRRGEVPDLEEVLVVKRGRVLRIYPPEQR